MALLEVGQGPLESGGNATLDLSIAWRDAVVGVVAARLQTASRIAVLAGELRSPSPAG